MSKVDKKMNYLLVGIGALVLVVAAIGVQSLNASSSGNPREEQSGTTAIYNGYGADVTLPATTSGDVYLFTEKPENGNYGDYADFTASEATSGMVQGDDYYQVSISSSDTATFNDLKVGETYYMAYVDSAGNYHTQFAEVTMPTEIKTSKFDKDQNVDLTDELNFFRTGTVDSENSYVFNELGAQGSTTALSANLDDPSSDTEDRERSVQHTVTVQNGQFFLGDLQVSSLIGDSSAVSTMDITVDAGEQSKEFSIAGDIGDKTSVEKELAASTEPIQAGDEITVTVDLVYDASSTSTSSSGFVDVDETVATLSVNDINGTTTGSSFTITG